MKKTYQNPAIVLPVKEMVFTIVSLVMLVVSSIGQNSKGAVETQVCNITKEEMNGLNKQVQLNINRLKAAGKLDFKKYKAVEETNSMESKTTANSILFRWPLATESYRDFPSWSILKFVDLDESSGVQDYNCKNRTYNNHNGIDIPIHPYSWELKKNGSVHAVAGAEGIIVYKHQGESDGSCENDFNCGDKCRGNNVVILHEDGTTASFYMHMKNGSLTPKQEGDFVRQGEYLGRVASAGNSSGPHLHFQVNTGYIDETSSGKGVMRDPFAIGNCAASTSTSWINEVPYNDPAVLTLETHYSLPDYYTGPCDSTISLYRSNSFSLFQTIFFRSEFRDWIDESSITHKIYQPNGALWHSYTKTNFGKSRIYFPKDVSYDISLLDPAGTYRYTVTFGGKTYSHYFTVNCETNKTLSGAAWGQSGTMVSNSIISTQTISGSSANYIKYMADGHVELKPGFQAAAGCRFVANLEGCNNSTAAVSAASIVQRDEKSLEENFKNKSLSANNLVIFPNPSNGTFTVNYEQEKPFDAVIVIRNMIGKVVYTSSKKTRTTLLQEKVNLGSQTKGMYLVEVNTGTQRFYGKVILQ